MGIADLVQDWDGFERLVANLHETGEVTVERNVTLKGRSGASRQIDVLIRHKQGLYEHLVVAECKYWNSRVQRADVDVVIMTVREIGASRGVIFSTKGFQSGAVLQAKHDGIELYKVRDLAAEEWGLPGRVVDMFLQVVQPSIGKIEVEGDSLVNAPITLPLEIGPEGFTSYTPTLTRDGLPGGDPLEKYLANAVQQALTKTLAEVQIINGDDECTRYVGVPVNRVPGEPFKIPVNGEILVIRRISLELVVKFQQTRITVDRAQRYRFALALENFVTGAVSSASRPLDAALTTLAEPKEPPPGEQVFVNGSLMRVVLMCFFPMEEMAGVTPVPIDQARRPFVPPPPPSG
jgi:hypothetical protein